MKQIAAIVALALTFVFVLAFPAFAQDGTVTVPWGSWLSMVLPVAAFAVLVLLVVALGYGVRLLPPWLQALAGPALQAQMIALASDALNWGVQAVRDATKDKELEISVGNKVIAVAVQDALDNWPQKIIDKLGGPDGVKKWILMQAEDHGVIMPRDSTAGQILSSPEVSSVGRP